MKALLALCLLHSTLINSKLLVLLSCDGNLSWTYIISQNSCYTYLLFKANVSGFFLLNDLIVKCMCKTINFNNNHIDSRYFFVIVTDFVEITENDTISFINYESVDIIGAIFFFYKTKLSDF